MNVIPMTRIAALIGEAGRIQMLAALLDDKLHSASELAMTAGVSPQTASSHLAKLVSGGLIVAERSGRQRLFRLANADVAAAIEALGALAEGTEGVRVPEVRFARSCYDHLAGAFAIALRVAFTKRDFLRDGGKEFILTTTGEHFLFTLGIDAKTLRGHRRSFSRPCLDWTERQHHIGGSLGAALLSRFIEIKWLARVHNTRAVRLTHEGERGFERMVGIPPRALRP